MATNQFHKLTESLSQINIRSRLTSPHASIKDVGQRRQASMLSSLLLVFALLSMVRVVIALISGSIYTDPTIPAFLVLVLLLFGAYVISRTKYQLWSGVLAYGTMSALIWVIIIVGGDYTPFEVIQPAMWLVVSVLIGGLLFPWWAGLIWSVLNIIPVFVLPSFVVGLETSSLTTVWTMMIVVTGIILTLNRNRDLQERDRQQELLGINQELVDLQAGLEIRVQDATRDLALAAEVGQRVSLVGDPESTLQEAAQVIRERFDLYYTQIYLVDHTGRNLVLSAGTGDVGQTLLQRGHRLAVNLASINGTAVVERKAVIVKDTETSTIHQPNPLLPETRSEMAVPLIAGDRVVGVIDLQSTRPGALREENLPAFEALAGQLAITILNAELFSQAERNRAEIEVQAQRLTQSGWQDFLNALDRAERIGFSFEDQSLSALTQPISELADDDDLVTTIAISGTPVGSFYLAKEGAWTGDDHALVESVSQQVSQQIENLRLLAQAEQYRAEAQEALGRLTREGWDVYQDETGLSGLGFIYQDNLVKSLNGAEDGFNAGLTYEIKVREEPIGSLSISSLDHLADGDVEMVDTITTQLSTHLENLRLSQQTERALASTENQASRLEGLNTLSEALSQAGTLDEIYKVSSTTLNRIVPADQASMTRLVDDGMLEVFALQGDAGAIPTGAKFPVKGTAIGEALRTRQVVIVGDITRSGHLENKQLAKQGLRSTMAVPLVVGGEAVGTINFGSINPNTYTDRERDLGTQAASLIASAVENRNLLEKTQNALSETEALLNITNIASRSFNLSETLNEVLDQVLNAISFEAGLISLVNPATGKLDLNANRLPGQMVIYLKENGLDGSLCDLVYKEAKPLVLDDLKEYSPTDATGTIALGFHSYQGVPLEAKGKILGTLCAFSTRTLSSQENNIQLLQAVGQQIGVAIENANLFEEIQLNEARFRTIVDNAPEAVIIVDVDNGVFADPNPNAVSLYGLPAEELVKVGPAEMSPAEQPNGRPSSEMAMEYIGAALQGTPQIFEWVHTNAQGEEIDCEVRLVRMPDPTRQLVRASVVDIRERKAAEAATAKRAAELATVAEVGTTVSGIMEPGEMLQTVVDLAVERFDLYHAHIYMLDPDGKNLTLAVGAGEVGRRMVSDGWQINLEAEQSLVAQAARERQGVIINDVQETPDFLENPLLPDTRAELAVPLIVGERVLGVLDVQSDSVGAFNAEDVSIQTTLASQIAVALQNAQTYAVTQRQAKHEALINLISQQIQSTTSVENALQVAVRELGRALGAKKTSVKLDVSGK